MNIKNPSDYVSFSLKGLFLFLLIVSSSYYMEYFGHNFKNIFKIGHYVPNIVIFLFIYFIVDLSLNIDGINKDDSPVNPIDLLKLSLYIYIFIILFTRCDKYCIIIISILLIISYFNYTFYKYFKQIGNINRFRKLKYIQNILYSLIIFILLIGFSLYFNTYFINSKAKNKSLLEFLFSFPKKI